MGEIGCVGGLGAFFGAVVEMVQPVGMYSSPGEKRNEVLGVANLPAGLLYKRN